MLQLGHILEEDNRENLGFDGWGRPLAPVTYRPDARVKEVDHMFQPYDNCTSSMYRSLAGPPLAPRGLGSRVVTGFETGWHREGSQWIEIGAWKNVLSIDAVPFMPFHFRGEGRLPKRDLAHVRPSAMRKAREALHSFMQYIFAKARS